MSAHGCQSGCKANDLVGSRLGWIVWGVPSVLFVVGIAWDAARTWLWIPSFVVAGSACLANASRCGRLHCFLTGPLFLLAAIATGADVAGILTIDWRFTLMAVIGGTAIGYGIEWLRGRYVRGATAAERSVP
jgi:hypothetical protein